jgi:hypothetical protein
LRRRFVAVAVLLALGGCAEKSDSQKASDAVKARIAERGKPLSIDCHRDRQLGAWICVATLPNPLTQYALCAYAYAQVRKPVAVCDFYRHPPPRNPKMLTIFD